MSAVAFVEQVGVEGGELIRRIARREPAKVIALHAAVSPRHAYNLREEIGQPDLAYPHFIALARRYPELRAKVLEWLEAEQGDNDRDPAQVLMEIAQQLARRGT